MLKRVLLQAGTQKMLSESALQKKIIKYLEAQGAWVVKIISCNKNGCPDLLAVHEGKFYAFEVKREDGKGVVSKLQKYRIKEIEKSGGIAYVVSSLDHVKKIMLPLQYEN